MNQRRFSFIRILPYVILLLTIAIIVFVGISIYEESKQPVTPVEPDQPSNEITMSLGATSGSAYVGDNRIEVSVLGNNFGTLTCTSSDNKVASCGITGTTLVVKPESKSGNATITVKEANGNNTVEYKIIVLSKVSTDDKDEDEDEKPTTGTTKPTASLSLSYSYGTIYLGKNATLYIKGSNYGTLSCSSSNTTVATCSISGTKLIITPKTTGTATITVKGTSGKTASYKATVAKSSTSTGSTGLSLSETKGVTSVGGSSLVATIKGNNYGTLSCTTSNRSVALCAINGTELKITPQVMSGTVTLTIKESKNNKTATYTVTVLPKGMTEVPTLSLSSTSGTTKGSILTATVSGTNYGRLTCSSSNTAIATCMVKDNLLSITPKKDGEVTITVKEATAGITATYKATVKYEYECLEGTLTNDKTYGTICITPGYEGEKASCLKYAEPTSNDIFDIDSDISSTDEYSKIQCSLKTSPQGYWDKYTCIITNCVEFDYKTVYMCPNGWSTYSGSNATLQCYKAASVKK